MDTVEVQLATVVVALPQTESVVAVSVAMTCSVPVYFVVVTVAIENSVY